MLKLCKITTFGQYLGLLNNSKEKNKNGDTRDKYQFCRHYRKQTEVFWVTLANPLTYAKNDKYLINKFPGKDKKAIFGSGFDLLHLNYGQKSYSLKPKYRTSEYAWFSLFI